MSLIAEALYRLEERAGIIEFDGGSTRDEAERYAIEQFESDEDFGQGIKRHAVRMFREKIEQQRADRANRGVPGGDGDKR